MERTERLRLLREDNSLTRKDIADILGMTEQCYQEYEEGKKSLHASILIKLSCFYNTSIDYLLGITDQKIPHPNKKDK